MSKTEPVAETEAPAKGGKKKVVLLGLGLLLAAVGASWFLLFPSKSAEAEEPVAHGEVVKLDPIAVNLAGGGYLKVGVALHLAEGAGGEEGGGPDGTKAQDLIISQFSQANPVDVAGARDALKASLQQRIVEAYEGEVVEIYFTEYVTQ